jgi:hypothetical protein
MKIKILAEDVHTGSFYNVKDCPIARALKREGFSFVSVGGVTAKADDKRFNISGANTKVMHMFNTKDAANPEFNTCIPIEDFEIELKQIN